MNSIAAIILAAGSGKRLNCKSVNKVMLSLDGKPMLSYTVDTLKKTGLFPIIAVVGFAKKNIMDFFKDELVYASQKKRLGTAHAVSCGLPLLPEKTKHVLIVNGDDSYLYTRRLLRRLITRHLRTKAEVTLLTVKKDVPFGLGRIVRNSKGKIRGIVEEKDAAEKERKITEINPQCWVFRVSFLRGFLKRIKKSKVTGEYYIGDLINLAVKHGKKVEDIKGGKLAWRGVNTPIELTEAKKLLEKSEN